MTTIDQIRARGQLGTPRSEVEALVGHTLTGAELQAFAQGRERWRINRAQEAKKRKAEAAAKREAEAKANIERLLEGTSWPGQGKDGQPLSSTERSRRHRERARDLGEIPRVRHRRVRESCRYDLLRFGLTYCMGPDSLLHRPPSERMHRFIRKLQETVLNGGNRHVRWPRGKGKTTWLKIAALWCLCYGHRKFVLFVSAAKGPAEVATKEIWEAFVEYPSLEADFPEIVVPLKDTELTPQRMRLQTYHGRRTGIEDTSARGGTRRLARLDGFPNTGGIIAARGADQRIRGFNVKSKRPDFIFIDDPQTGSETEGVLNKIEANIQNVILNLGSTDVKTAAVMATTPVKLNDISERFADPERNPAWETTTERLVIQWGPEEWRNLYFSEWRKSPDAARRFYVEHQAEIEKGVIMLDDNDGDRRVHVSAYQFALDKLLEIGETAFYAEFQMRPPASAFAFEISQKLILSRIRKGVPPNTVPAGSVFVAAATDINPSYALTTAIVSFDVTLAGLVVAYHVTPIHIPDALNDVAFENQVYSAIAAHGREIAALGIKIDKWGVDAGGRQFRAVTRFAPESRALCNVQATPMLGRAGRNWNPNVRSRIRAPLNDTVRCRDPQGREWTAFNADVYKERAQKAWGAEVAAPGSLSLFDGHADHTAFAMQIANEKLKGKIALGDDRWKFVWDTADPHDYGDCMAMCYGLAGSEGLTGDGTYGQRKGKFEVVML